MGGIDMRVVLIFTSNSHQCWIMALKLLPPAYKNNTKPFFFKDIHPSNALRFMVERCERRKNPVFTVVNRNDGWSDIQYTLTTVSCRIYDRNSPCQESATSLRHLNSSVLRNMLWCKANRFDYHYVVRRVMRRNSSGAQSSFPD